MKKLAFVAPWYGKDIPGGAEMELRDLVRHLASSGVELEILTTCIREFAADWNINHYKEGIETVRGVTIRRFAVAQKDRTRFASINARLMKNIRVAKHEEDIFLEQMAGSDRLTAYIKKHKDDYSYYIYIPYMFGTTYYGVKACPEKSIMIPCLHNEAYAYFERFKETYSKVSGMVFNSEPEAQLARDIYDLSNVKTITLGIGMDTDISGDEERFRKQTGISSPYIMYAGRKDEGKNIYTLIKYFAKYKELNKDEMKLVLIGGGTVSVPDAIKEDVIDLGFVERQTKYDAYAGALTLCQPSLNESFSLVIMESWLCGRPVVVHERCDVTKDFVLRSGGGLYFDNYFEFEGCINYLKNHRDIAKAMGESGGYYVKSNFAWDIVLDRFKTFIRKLSEKNHS